MNQHFSVGSMRADFNFLCGLISISRFLFVKHFVWLNHVVSSPSCVAHIDLIKAAFGRIFQTRANFPNSGENL